MLLSLLKLKDIVKLGSLVSQTEWSEISERNSNLIENLKKGTKVDSIIQKPPTTLAFQTQSQGL